MTSKSGWISCACFVLCLLTVIVVSLCLYLGYRRHNDAVRPVVSDETNETFYVQNNPGESEQVAQEVARRLSRLAKKADHIVNTMMSQQAPTPEIAERLARRWRTLRSNPKGLREIGRGETSAAYTINKGDELRICVRDETSGRPFEEENTGFLVLLHELAHLMSSSYGHNDEFKDNYTYIAKLATELGLYTYVDYAQTPVVYCGTKITHAPY